MPQFYQYKDKPAIYRKKVIGQAGEVQLQDPFKSEQEFFAAGGTKYWTDPRFKNQGWTGNVEMLTKAVAPQPQAPTAKGRNVMEFTAGRRAIRGGQLMEYKEPDRCPAGAVCFGRWEPVKLSAQEERAWLQSREIPSPDLSSSVSISELDEGDAADPTIKYPELFREKGKPEVYGTYPGGQPKHLFPGQPEKFTETYGQEGWGQIADLTPQEFTAKFKTGADPAGMLDEVLKQLTLQEQRIKTGLEATLSARLATEKAEAETAKAGEKTAVKSFLETAKGFPAKIGELLTGTREKFGVEAAETKMTEAMESYYNIEAEEQKAIEGVKTQTRARGVPGWAMRGQISVIQSAFAAEKSAAAAKFNIAQGNHNMAYQNFKDSFNAQSKAYNVILNTFETMMNYSVAVSQDEKEDFQQVRKQIDDYLMLDYGNRANTFATLKTEAPDAPITAGMTVAEMYETAQPYLSEIAKLKRQKLVSDIAGGGAKTVSAGSWIAKDYPELIGLALNQVIPFLVTQAQDERASEKDRQLASIKANIQTWLDTPSGEKGTRENLIEQLVATHDKVPRAEINTEVMGLTKETEKPLTTKVGEEIGGWASWINKNIFGGE